MVDSYDGQEAFRYSHQPSRPAVANVITWAKDKAADLWLFFQIIHRTAFNVSIQESRTQLSFFSSRIMALK